MTMSTFLDKSVMCLDVMSMADGIEISMDGYLEVQNYNDATQYVDARAEINQMLAVDIVS
jgi:hypothetical protein